MTNKPKERTIREVLIKLQENAIASGYHSCGNIEEDKKDLDQAEKEINSIIEQEKAKMCEGCNKNFSGKIYGQFDERPTP